MLIGRALRDRRDKALLSVKFGALRAPDGSWLGIDTRPAAVKNFLGYTLHAPRRRSHRHLPPWPPRSNGPDRRHHRRDRRSGEGRATSAPSGCPRSGADTIRRAHAVHPITDLQIEYSLDQPRARGADLSAAGGARHRRHRLRRAVARPAQRLEADGQGDFRAYLPRFTGENRERNQRLVDALQKLAAEKGVTPSQLAIAWVLAKGKRIVPLIGARTRAQLEESLGALDVRAHAPPISRASRRRCPPRRSLARRYGEEQMQHLDSER